MTDTTALDDVYAVGFAYRITLNPHDRGAYADGSAWVAVEAFDAVTGRRVDYAIVPADPDIVAGQIASMAAFHEETAARIGVSPFPCYVERPTIDELINALSGVRTLPAPTPERF